MPRRPSPVLVRRGCGTGLGCGFRTADCRRHPVDFILFGLTLVGVALFHRHTLGIAVSGLAAITVYNLAFSGFKEGSGIGGLVRGPLTASAQEMRRDDAVFFGVLAAPR